MKKNIGSSDKMIRIILGVVLALLYFTKNIEGTFGTVSIIVAALLLATSLINFCPLYAIFGLRTNKKSSQ